MSSLKDNPQQLDTGAARGARGRRPSTAIPGREALLPVAVSAFARNGYEGTSLRALAAEAQVDAALVARLFGSKADLWTAVVGDLADRQLEHLMRVSALAEEAVLDGRAAIEGLIALMVDIGYDLPEFPALLLLEAGNPGWRLEALLARLVRPFQEACAPVLQAAADCGALPQGNRDLQFTMLMSAVAIPIASPQLWRRNSPDKAQRQEVARTATALFVRGSG